MCAGHWRLQDDGKDRYQLVTAHIVAPINRAELTLRRGLFWSPRLKVSSALSFQKCCLPRSFQLRRTLLTLDRLAARMASVIFARRTSALHNGQSCRGRSFDGLAIDAVILNSLRENLPKRHGRRIIYIREIVAEAVVAHVIGASVDIDLRYRLMGLNGYTSYARPFPSVAQLLTPTSPSYKRLPRRGSGRFSARERRPRPHREQRPPTRAGPAAVLGGLGGALTCWRYA